MNICFVLVSRGWGGGENVVHQIISCMVKKNIKVSLILNNEMKKHFDDLDIKMLDLGSLYDSKSLLKMIIKPDHSVITGDSHPIKLLNMLLMYIYFYRARKRINNFLKAEQIDIIHSHLEYSDILSYIIHKDANSNVKWISTVHGPWFSLFYSESKISSISNFFFRTFLKKAIKDMNKITFVSKYLFDEAFYTFGKVVEKKGIIIHNGIDLSRFKDVGTLKLKEGFGILFPGGPKLKKGGDILIEAIKNMAEIKDLNLYIALEVPDDHLIRQLVKRYGLENNVHFVGFLNPSEYMALLNSVDILAMPSRMEPFGMVYLEAMALGVPIIASNVGGAPEIIEGFRNGVLTSPKPDAVAKAILTLYSDETLRKKISENNLKDSHKFEWKNIVGEYIKSYEELNLKND